MINKTSVFCLSIVIVLIGASCFAEEQLSLTLPDGLRMALSQNPDLRVESYNYAISDAEVARSRGIYDPVLFLSASGGGTSYARDDRGMDKNAAFSIGISQFLPTGGTLTASTETSFYSVSEGPFTKGTTDSSSSASVFFSQPLLKNAGPQNTELSITIAENAREDAAERYKNSALDTVSSFLSNYNRLFTLRQLVKTKEQSLNAAMNLLTETGAKQTVGTASRLDAANAEYGVAFRRKELVDAERGVRDQESILRYILGNRDKTPIFPIDPPDLREPEESEDQAVKMALEMRPDLRLMLLSLKITELQERIAKNQTLPDFVLNASATSAGYGGSVGDNLHEMGFGTGWWQAGGQFSIPLGNTSARNEYRKAKLRTEQLKTQISALQMRVENDVRSDMRAIISARLQLMVAKKSRESAEQRLAEYRANLQAGTAGTQEVLEAEADLSAARNSEIEAAEGFSNAVTKLWRDMGVLLEKKGISFMMPSRGKKVDSIPVEPKGQPVQEPAQVEPPVTHQAPASSTTVSSPPSVSPASVDGSKTSKKFAVRIVMPDGVPLAQGTTVHDLDGREWLIGPNGIVEFHSSTALIPIVGKSADDACWAVVATPTAESATDIAEAVCHPVR